MRVPLPRFPAVAPIAIVLALLIVAAFAPVPQAVASPDTGEKSETAVRVAKVRSKLDGRLSARARSRASRGLRGLLPPDLSLALTPAETVQVVAGAPAGRTAAARSAIEAYGGTVEIVAGSVLQFTAPVDVLEGIATSSDIVALREPYPVATFAVAGQGVAVSSATAWHEAGYTGRGLKIGVLDAGFAGYQSRLGTELPASVTAHSVRSDGDITGRGEVHGTAVAEIVHEMAPDAALVLVNYSHDLDFGLGVKYLQSQGVDVITNSTGSFLWGPGDGTGAVNQTVTSAVQSGIVWTQAAGNHARKHWAGRYGDSDGDGRHNFATDSNANAFSTSLTAGTTVLLSLKWDDVWGASCTDYDLYLYSPSGTEISDPFSKSEGPQNCTQDPVEWIRYTVPANGVYRAVIKRYDWGGVPGPNPTARLDLYSTSHDLSVRTAAGSLTIPADNALALAVGAHNWATPDTVEGFSSQGPTRDGRTKPDLTAPDGVASASYGIFSGTSAAAPHAGAAAALVIQANPNYTPAQVKAFLTGRAVDTLEQGTDNVSGSGRLTLGTTPAALDPATAQFAAPVAAPANGTTAAPVTVAVRGAGGAVVAGKPVALSSSRGGVDSITPAIALTDAEGRSHFAVTSSLPGPVVLTARAIAEGAALGSVPVTFMSGVQALTVTPPTGPSQRTVQVRGSGFVPLLGGIEVRWGSAETPLVNATADASGAFTVTVTTPSGATPSQHQLGAMQGLLAAAATYDVAASGISLDAQTLSAGADLTVSGTTFYPTVPVNLALDGGIVLANIAPRNDGTFLQTLTLPGETAPGQRTIEATQNGPETLRANAQLTVTVPLVISSVGPTTAGQGAVGRVITVAGSGFREGMTATVSGTGVSVASVHVENSATAAVALSVSPVAPVGLRSLTFRNPDGGTAVRVDAITVTAAPSIASVSTAELAAGSTVSDVQISGSGFDPAATVLVSGSGLSVANVAASGGNRVTFDLSGAAEAATGPRDIIVVNPDGGRTTAAGVVRVLGRLDGAEAGRTATGDVVISFVARSAIPASGKIAVVVAPPLSMPSAQATGMTAGGEACAPGSASPTAGGIIVPVGSCAVGAGSSVTLTISGMTTASPPASVALSLRTEEAGGRGLDLGTATLWQPVLSSDNEVRPVRGEAATLTGTGFPPSRTLHLTTGNGLGPDVDVTTDALGSLASALPIPSQALPGPYAVEAKDGVVQASTAVVVAPDPTATISPPSAGTAATFRLAGHGFLPAEQISIGWNNSAAATNVAADGNGTILVDTRAPEGSSPGLHTITLTGAGRHTAEATATLLEHSPRLRGRIQDSDGARVANARGWASAVQPTTGLPFSVDWSTGDDGAFAVDVPPGSFNVGAFVEGRLLREPEQPVEVMPSGQTPQEVVFTVAPGEVHLTGRVVAGTPNAGVPNAQVLAVEIDGAGTPNGRTARAHTVNDGRFAFALPAGHRWSLSANAEGLPPVPATMVADGAAVSTDQEVNLRVPAAVAITGGVMMAGRPAAIVPVSLSGPGGVVTRTKSDGSYVLNVPLPADAPAVYRIAAGSADRGTGAAVIIANPDGTLQCTADVGGRCPDVGSPGGGPDFALPEGGIRVYVTESGGENLVAPVLVSVRAMAGSVTGLRSERTAEGFMLPLPSGDYELDITIAGILQQHMNGVRSPGAVTVELPPLVTLRGVVTDGAAGVGGAMVIVEQQSDPRLQLSATACSTGSSEACAEGSFAVRVPANASYRVRAARVEYLASPGTAVLAGPSDPSVVRLEMTPLDGAPFVSGEMTGIDAAAPATVTATLRDGRTLAAQRNVHPEGCTAPMGRYCMRLPPGTWTFTARAEGFVLPGPAPAVVVPASGPAPTGPTLAMVAPGPSSGALDTANVNGQAGGSVLARGSGVSVNIPGGAILGQAGPVGVTVRVVSDVAMPGGVQIAGGRALQIDLRDEDGRRLTSFARPLTITIPYGDLIAAGQLSEAAAVHLTCARYDPVAALWTPLSGLNDAVRRELTCFTERLTKIAALTGTIPVTPPPAPTPTPPPVLNAGGGGGGGGGSAATTATSTPVPTPTRVPTAATVRLAADGSGVLSVQHVAAVIPAGKAEVAGLEARLELVDAGPATAMRLQALPVDAFARVPAGQIAGTTAFTFTVGDSRGMSVSVLPVAVTLKVGYREEDLRRAGGEPGHLSLARWDGEQKGWTLLKTAVDKVTGTLHADTTAAGLFSVLAVVPQPVVTGPAAGSVSVDMAPSLRWNVPPGTNWHHVQVIPHGNDGPGINLLIGDPAVVAAGRFDVPAPEAGIGNYILLPGMSYSWRVRVSPAAWPVGESDLVWSAWQEGTFRTGGVTSTGLAAASPSRDNVAASRTPVLSWTSSNPRLYYYEVQLSRDPAFESDPTRAVAAVYWNLVHGGLSQPPNTWAVPPDYPLEPDVRYYWRVRPRVQGDGIPVDWSATATFIAPP